LLATLLISVTVDMNEKALLRAFFMPKIYIYFQRLPKNSRTNINENYFQKCIDLTANLIDNQYQQEDILLLIRP
ncbi:hypothetical protein, partial [Pseudoalteromonas piscicida]|uniref:hypothetical protein n=1 Tax=Pseudoalteromonas piscicida TaxID=43662 RepID=UPI00110B22A3